MSDPWKHRGENMRCKTCMWFVGKEPSAELGRCRRHAPTMNGFPAVFVTDWCGDHKLDENKLTPPLPKVSFVPVPDLMTPEEYMRKYAAPGQSYGGSA